MQSVIETEQDYYTKFVQELTNPLVLKTEVFNFKDNIYHNQAQNPDIARILFVCNMGMLRSPTAAAMAIKQEVNARSCGTDEDALIRISSRLIQWADIVVFMHKDSYIKTIYMIDDIDPDTLSIIKYKAVAWNIPDEYEYMHSDLIWHIEPKLKELLNNE